MKTNRVLIHASAVLAILAATSVQSAAQSLSPPRADYVQKVSGMFELRNNSDVPMVGIVEVRGFSLDEKGSLRFTDPAPGLNVEFGSSSFVIPPHDRHYVFYKADPARVPVWFTLISTLSPATPVHKGLRVAVVLPHFVYVFQKGKIKSGDVEVSLATGTREGECRLNFKNLSEKLARVETIRGKGFASKSAHKEGLLIYPGSTRSISLETGTATARAEFEIRFQGGYHFKVPYSTLQRGSPSVASLLEALR